MAVRRVVATRPLRFWRARSGLLAVGFCAIVLLVLGSPLLMASLSGTALPWGRLADVGDAFGGASALLSAVALCGIGASLIFQQRQIRQELADIDRQQHLEIIRLAIDNPELIEVLNGEPAGPHARQEFFANLTMMYWLTLWELHEIDDDELRAFAAAMFRSPITRRWWSRVGEVWIGTRQRPQRVRFLSIISAEMIAAESASARPSAPPTGDRPAAGRGTAVTLGASLAAAGLAFAVGRHFGGRRTAILRDAGSDRSVHPR